MYKVDNAIIMAAGTSSRFAPLSYEIPKALIEVKGEVLVERQIRQLKEAGVRKIVIVVGYMKENFSYLTDKFGVEMIENKEYLERNNNSSIHAARDYLKNSYICSADNYFSKNPFSEYEEEAYYAAVYADGKTQEWCMEEDEKGYISQVTIGGSDAWYMLGHAFWDERFSRKFLDILERVYDEPDTKDMLWEKIFMNHLSDLKMKIRKYDDNVIFEFDTLDELRRFDRRYITDSGSAILRKIVEGLDCKEEEITKLKAIKKDNTMAAGFTFQVGSHTYEYSYETGQYRRIRQ